MKPRFYSDEAITSDVIELRDSEHQHMTKVMRLGIGDEVTLFDGSGTEYEATISEVGRQTVRLTIESSQAVDRELPFDLTMAVALPKGDRQQWLIEKLVELGVTRLMPLITERGVAQPGEKAMKRIHRWIIAASKQCRRNRLMIVTEPRTISQLISENELAEVLIAHPTQDAESIGRMRIAKGLAAGSCLCVAVGPEGGFTENEVTNAVREGATQVTLGRRILRIETAAIAIASTFVFGNSDE